MTARRALGWSLALLIPMALYTLGLAAGRPDPRYAPSLAQRAWLNPSQVYHPDEFAYVGLPYRMLLTRQWNPHYYHNPSLTLNTNLVFFAVSGAARWPHNTAYGDREIAPFTLIFSARVLSALYTLLTVPITFAAGRVAFGRRAGVIAAALVAVVPLSVQHAHYATPNAQTVMLASAALLAGLAILRGRIAPWLPVWAAYGAAGLLVGLTASARYNAAVVGLVVGVALLADARRRGRWLPAALGLAALPLGFALGTPGIVLATREVIDQVRDILDWYRVRGGGPGFTAGRGAPSYFIHLRYLVLMVLGPLVMLAGLGGLVLALRRLRRPEGGIALLLAAYALAYTLFALAGSRLQANLLPPLLAPLALLAAYATVRLGERWGGGRRGRPTALAALLLAWPLAISLLFVYRVATPDNRLRAQAWVYAHVPRGASVYLLGPYNVPLDPLDYEVTQTFGREADPEDVAASDADIVIYSDAYPHLVLRDPSLSAPEHLARERGIQQVLAEDWVELQHFDRWPWPGENLPPDDVSYWHQMGITIYCHPAHCPVDAVE